MSGYEKVDEFFWRIDFHSSNKFFKLKIFGVLYLLLVINLAKSIAELHRVTQNDLIMLPSEKLNFQGPYLRQNWSLPNSFIYNLATKPSNAKGFAKLVKSCKYFYSKNPVLVVTRLVLFSDNRWAIFGKIYDNKEWLDIKNLTVKLWITNTIESIHRSILQVYPKLYKTDYKKLSLNYQTISYNDFLFISSNVENVELVFVVVKNEDGSIVPFEKLVKTLPKIKYIFLFESYISSMITSNTVKELLIIPHFSKISKIVLREIPETFDIETFFAFIKKNKISKFDLRFSDTVSDAYKTRLEVIIDEILQTEKHDYKVPNIYFFGCDPEKSRKYRSKS